MLHGPNKLELMLTTIIVATSILNAILVVSWILTTQQLPTSVVVSLTILITIISIMVMQNIFNFFYAIWQRKHYK